MAIFSIDLHDAFADGEHRAVIVKRKLGKLELAQALKASAHDLRKHSYAYDTFLSTQHLDVATEQIPLPPLAGEKMARTLIANRLRERLKTKQELLFTYHKDPEKLQDNKPVYHVIAVPETWFEQDLGLPDTFKHRLHRFTLSRFSLTAISGIFAPESLVFHAYADESRILVTVSRGNVTLYARITPLSGRSSPEELSNIAYENINLTYMYVRQQNPKGVDFVILSGLLHNDNHLKEQVEQFSGKKVTILQPEQFISNCSMQTFHTYLIPIANALLDASYNILPRKYVQEQSFRKVVKWLNIAVVLALYGLLQYVITLHSDLGLNALRASTLSRSVSEKYDALKDRLEHVERLQYQSEYINTIDARNSSPVAMLPALQETLSQYRFERIELQRSADNTPFVMLSVNVVSGSLPALALEKAKWERVKKQAEEAGFTIEDQSSFSEQELKATIICKLRKGGVQ